jgi:hypothetical protein
MPQFKHPGIDMVHNMRQKAGYTDDWEVNQPIDKDIMDNLRKSKMFLDSQMQKIPPAQLSDKDITELRKFEVAIVYAGIVDPDNASSARRLANIIRGRDGMDQPSDSELYLNRRKHAQSELKLEGRISTALDF